MRLAMTDLFRAKWTDQIHEEWIENLLADRRDLERHKLERTRKLMNLHVRDCLVTGYEPLIDAIELPDPDDRHVLATAVRAGANVIVTFNLKDFPFANTAQFGVEAQHPDEFVTHLIDLAPHVVCNAVKHQRESLRSNPSVAGFFATLETQGLAHTVAALRPFAKLL